MASREAEIPFAARRTVEQVEEGTELAPKFDAQGLIPCVTLHHRTREILMVGYMNAEAFRATVATGLAHYWSRSRQKLWKKGESSGMYQKVERMLIDDDQDCVALEVSLTPPTAGGEEASCHVGYRSCFYRAVPTGDAPEGPRELIFVEEKKAFDPVAIYGDAPNPTQL